MAGPTPLPRVARVEPPASPSPSRDGGLLGHVRRRLAGLYTVDPWGLDDDVHASVAAAVGWRWDVVIGGSDRVPVEGPALLVLNDRLASFAPLAAVVALGREVGRSLRFVGVPDIEPLATALRRLGGVLERPDELSGLLREGQVAVVWCRSPVRGGLRVGRVAPALLAPALSHDVPVLPVALHGRRFGRVLRIDVGAQVRPRTQVGPLASVELAAEVRAALQTMLDDAAPPRWPIG